MEQNTDQFNPIQETKKPNRALRLLAAGTAVGTLVAGPLVARRVADGGGVHTSPLKEKIEQPVPVKATPTTETLPVTSTTEAPVAPPVEAPAVTTPTTEAPQSQTNENHPASHVTHEQHAVTHSEAPANPADQYPAGATVEPDGAATSSASLTKNPDGSETYIQNGQVMPNPHP